MPTPEDNLTEKQRQVLALVRRDPQPTPTEIAKELGITSQAVHGHFRRLRGHGLMPAEGTAPGRAAARARRTAGFDPTDALAVVHQAARDGIAKAERRQQEIDDQLAALKAERKTLDTTIGTLRQHLPADAA